MPTTTPPPALAPCHGLRDTYHDTVQPLPMCLDCQRWLQRHTSGQPIRPAAEVVGAVVPMLRCRDRVEG